MISLREILRRITGNDDLYATPNLSLKQIEDYLLLITGEMSLEDEPKINLKQIHEMIIPEDPFE